MTMKQSFKSVADVVSALRDTDMVDSVVYQMAGNDKNLLGRLKDIVDVHFVADARTMEEGHLNQFAQRLYDVAYAASEPA